MIRRGKIDKAKEKMKEILNYYRNMVNKLRNEEYPRIVTAYKEKKNIVKIKVHDLYLKRKREIVIIVVVVLIGVIGWQVPSYRAQCYIAKGKVVQVFNKEKALVQFERAWITKDSPSTRYNIIKAYEAAGYTKKFKVELVEALEKYPNDAKLKRLMAEVRPIEPRALLNQEFTGNYRS